MTSRSMRRALPVMGPQHYLALVIRNAELPLPTYPSVRSDQVLCNRRVLGRVRCESDYTCVN